MSFPTRYPDVPPLREQIVDLLSESFPRSLPAREIRQKLARDYSIQAVYDALGKLQRDEQVMKLEVENGPIHWLGAA